MTRAAPGQPSGRTAVYGIIGDPVAHSLSPWMHRLFAEQQGVDMVYVPFPVQAVHLEAALRGLPALGVRGVNVTVPHKEAVLPFLDALTPEAKAIGAVNTLYFADQRMSGHNTDAIGFTRALTAAAGADWRGRAALVIGAGGAARAIIYALGVAGCAPIFLANRHLPRAVALARQFPQFPVQPLPLEAAALARPLGAVTLLVNTSSRGLHGEDHPELDLQRLPVDGIVCDIVYNPLETPLLRAARRVGRRAVDGLGMLVQQGAESFQGWTGLAPQSKAIQDTLSAWLQTQKAPR